MVQPIATVPELRAYIKGLPTDSDTTELLSDLIDRASAIITEYIGFEYEGYESPATTKRLQSQGSEWLILPPHQVGSVTQITTEASGAVPVPTTVWIEDADSGHLRLLYANGWIMYGASTGPYGWAPGWYQVTAEWGWGPVPEDLKQACLEIATNLWREKDKGAFSDVVGIVGSGSEARVGYQKGLTNRQLMILDLHRQKRLDTLPLVIG